MEDKYITVEELCRDKLDGNDKKYAVIADCHDATNKIFKTGIKYVGTLNQLADEVKILMDKNTLVTKDLQPWRLDIEDGETNRDFNKGYLYYYVNFQDGCVKSIKVIDLDKDEYDTLIKKLKIRYFFDGKDC